MHIRVREAGGGSNPCNFLFVDDKSDEVKFD